MESEDYKYIDIDGVSIAYIDSGSGTPMLFIHGFGSFSFTWKELIRCLPRKFRFITVDLKGYGYSEKKCDDHLSPFDQSIIVTEFIKRMELDDIILVGHSMGGAISLISLFNDEIRARISRLILIDSAGLFQKLPDFIDELASTSPSSPLLKFASEEIMTLHVLKQVFFNKDRMSEATVKEYSSVLRQENAKECLIGAARQIAIANIRSFHRNISRISIPVLIIWGENDTIIDVEDAFHFRRDIKNSKLEILPECGHSPQEELPFETAGLIADFLGEEMELSEPPPSPSPSPEKEKGEFPVSESFSKRFPATAGYIRKIRMSRLVDEWSLGAVLVMIFIKILQFLRKLGFRTEANGWRKATGIFLRKEHSKFTLASFRLNYSSGRTSPRNTEEAKGAIIERLADFLRRNPACHWTLEWGFFMSRRKKLFFTDMVEVKNDKDGFIVEMKAHLDNTRPMFTMLNDEIITSATEKIKEVYNQKYREYDRKRAWIIYKNLKLWAWKFRGLSYTGRQELNHLIERILNATFIQFEALSDDPSLALRQRLATPNMKNRRHPGFGLLNIICRFTADYSEADLWFQHHHIPVDGMPMQEMLRELKSEWGSKGLIKYPALDSSAARAEIIYAGNRIFRARIFMDFSSLMQVRKQLNEKYYAQMGGPATIASMFIWGLTQHRSFRRCKFLFPVDTSLMKDFPQDRNISLVFIRPCRFFDSADPLNGFLKYQREFNQRLFATRMGKSESYELLELYAITHPLFYYIARYLMPETTGEFLGTAGLTIIRDAEMFISPLTDLQFDGFVALGNLMMPTEDGKTAGAVSICGSRKLVRAYIEAFNGLVESYRSILYFPET